MEYGISNIGKLQNPKLGSFYFFSLDIHMYAEIQCLVHQRK